MSRVRALELQPPFAGGVRQRLDAAVIEVMAAIEYHVLDAGGHCPLGNELSHRLGSADIGAGLKAGAHVLFERRRRCNCRAFAVVDHLGIDVLGGAKDAQPQSCARSRLDGASDARLAPFDLLGSHGRSRSTYRYFFLPSLRKMYSPEYLTPLPL